MKIVFTGTSKGKTARRLQALTCELQAYDISEAHHGDCVGADTEFHNLICDLFPKAKIVGHPGFPESDSRRANNPCDEVRFVPIVIALPITRFAESKRCRIGVT